MRDIHCCLHTLKRGQSEIAQSYWKAKRMKSHCFSVLGHNTELLKGPRAGMQDGIEVQLALTTYVILEVHADGRAVQE